MNTNTTETLTSGQFRGRRFFSEPAFRSAPFLIVSGLLLLAIAANSFILIRNWNHIPSSIAFCLTIFGYGGVIAPWLRAFWWHGRLHELHVIGELRPEEGNKVLDIAQDAAANLALDALFFGFTSILMLLGIVGYLLAGGPILTH